MGNKRLGIERVVVAAFGEISSRSQEIGRRTSHENQNGTDASLNQDLLMKIFLNLPNNPNALSPPRGCRRDLEIICGGRLAAFGPWPSRGLDLRLSVGLI
jgi:hypothetical protein